jgi:putative hydrolase of the HAD superfamily
VYAAVAKEFGIQCEPDLITRQFADAWRARKNFGYTLDEWRELVRQSFHGSQSVLPEMFDAIYERFAEPGAWLIYEDVIPTLETLAEKGIKMAVISNWDERLIRTLEGLGLGCYFEKVIVSSALGAHKPDPRIFDHAARELGVPPGEIIHVGDSEREDVAGARAAGFQARRIRRSGVEKQDDINRLTAIPPLIH